VHGIDRLVAAFHDDLVEMPNEQICEAIQVRLMAAHPCVIPNGLNFRGAQWLLAIGARLELAHVGGLALEPKWLIPCVDERVVAPSLGLRASGPRRVRSIGACAMFRML